MMQAPRLVATRATLAALTLISMACVSFAPARRPSLSIAEADQSAKLAVATENAIDPSRIPPSAVSVLPFIVASSDTLLAPLGYGLSAFLISDLARSRDLRLVERERIDAIYRELDLIDQGAVDPRTGPRVGRLVGARRVVIGSVTRGNNNTVILGARVVDAIAGTVQDVATGTVPLDQLFEGQKALSLRVFEQLGVNVSPALRASVEEGQTRNVAAAVAFGRGLRAEARGDLDAARRAFEDAARLDVGFATARAEAARVEQRASGSSATSAGSGVDALTRVVDLAAGGINVPVATKLPEAVDAPAQSFLITLLITLRVF
jgi:TolB-like protein